ncbi:30S ribosomal protein S6--L-glutamate ligase [Rubritalea spongiae]|uniref:30S ribosomal protein S6--L-glutamate ligase n=1 Tax=Rubritalea spongiae TaxID=430797 RepID=A0ABW5E3W7_9BACT
MNEQKLIVGSSEWLALPSLNVPAIKARVDSGAKTSSLHAFNIHSFTRDGENWVNFDVHPIQKNRKTVVRCEAKTIDKRVIKSSNGEREKRYVIRTTLELAGETFSIEVTLTNRDTMGYRMLLGREAMQGRMLVDPSEELCHGELNSEEIIKLYGISEPKHKGLNIGILASNPNLYSNQRIIEAGEQRGHNIHFVNIKHCYLKMDAESPAVLLRGGHSLNMLDAVIPRIRPSVTFYGCALTRHFESIGKYSLNSSDSISRSRDKLFSMQLMLKHGLDIPTSGFAHSPMDTNDLIEMVGGAPLIVKLLEGSQGRGVVLAETKKAAESVINAFKALNANLLVQEFVKEADGKDLRCFVIDGKVVASIERSAAAGEFRANIHQGGQANIVKITPQERALAIKSAKAFGLQVAGVDIIRSRKGPLLLEVNSSPGLEGIETATGKDIAGLMIRAIEKKLGWQPAPADKDQH